MADGLVWSAVAAGRIVPVIFLVPALGGRRLPVPARLALAAIVAFALAPGVHPSNPPSGLMVFAGLLLKELAVGVVLALAVACLFEGVRMGGRLIDSLRGAGAARSLAPLTDEQDSPLGMLHLMLAVLFFFAAGGPSLLLKALHATFAEVPLDALPDSNQGQAAARMLIGTTTAALRTGVAVAFPAALAVFMTDVLLGFVNRSAPQIQVFFLGMPLRAGVGIVAVILTLDGTVENLLGQLAGFKA